VGGIDIGYFSFAGEAEEHDLEAVGCESHLSAFYVKG
jgi:hypothetical protein